MALMSIRRLFENEFSWQDNNRRVRVRKFQLIFDSILTEDNVVEVAAGLPQIHDNWDGATTYLKVSRLSGRQDKENPYVWIVTIEYTNELWLPKAEYLNTDPLLRKAEIALDVETYTEAFHSAINETTGLEDVPIVNTSNEPFIPPFTREKGILVLNISLHIEDVNYAQFDDWIYSTNSAIWNGLAIDKALITSLSALPSYEAGKPGLSHPFHWILNAKVKYKSDGWRLKPLNMGKIMRIQRTDGAFRYVQIRGSDHRPITSPMPLTSNSEPIWPGSGLSFHYLDFKKYRSANFDSILPNARMP